MHPHLKANHTELDMDPLYQRGGAGHCGLCASSMLPRCRFDKSSDEIFLPLCHMSAVHRCPLALDNIPFPGAPPQPFMCYK